MAKPTNIDFQDFLKAVRILAVRRGFFLNEERKKGSAIRFELFKDKNDTKPYRMWVVHEDLKEKKIYSDDLKKACKELGVTKEDFDNLIKNKFK